MADELDALLERVEDPALRERLTEEIGRLRRKRQFGLVFESHLPERVRLHDHPIRRGCLVVKRDAPAKVEPLAVIRVRGQKVVVAEGEIETEFAKDDLVVVAEFGQPIYPGLRHVGSVQRGGDKPAHTVIKAENYHALQALRFSHAGKVDCIYIDPPYNTGAKDWKYDNAYVDAEDGYRHSKWLAFMERRLLLARELLNPSCSVLIVAIDEKEYLRLGLLLQQLFTSATIQMVSSVINPKGTGRTNEFRRVDEYLYFVRLGDAQVSRVLFEELDEDEGIEASVDWQTFRRRDLASVRRTRPGQFYPIYVGGDSGLIEAIGEPLSHETPREQAEKREGCEAVFPVRPDGTEMNWSVTAPTCRKRWQAGYLRAGKSQPGQPQQFIVQYLKSGTISDICEGRAVVKGRNPDGSIVATYPVSRGKFPTTQWSIASHNAEHYGTRLIKPMLPGQRFPFPKSLYAVEDALRVFFGEANTLTVLDFFAGSGTTAHAVARLNRQDGGRRQSISITNNEVSADEAQSMRKRGLRPGDAEWEALGIFEHITKPRITAAITGKTPEGDPVKGAYKFTDEFPMAEGFEENVEFFELTYLDAQDIELDLAFESVAPLLWLRAGSAGPIIDSRRKDDGELELFKCTPHYGVLFDPDHWRAFVDSIAPTMNTAFIVTDSASEFAGIAGELPSSMDVVRLYENYLATFAFEHG